MSWHGRGISLVIRSLPVAGVSLGEEEPDPGLGEHALLHGESLLVVASGDSEDVALPLVSEGGGVNVLTHALLVEGAHLKKRNCIQFSRTSQRPKLITDHANQEDALQAGEMNYGFLN